MYLYSIYAFTLLKLEEKLVWYNDSATFLLCQSFLFPTENVEEEGKTKGFVFEGGKANTFVFEGGKASRPLW